MLLIYLPKPYPYGNVPFFDVCSFVYKPRNRACCCSFFRPRTLVDLLDQNLRIACGLDKHTGSVREERARVMRGYRGDEVVEATSRVDTSGRSTDEGESPGDVAGDGNSDEGDLSDDPLLLL